MLIVLVIILNLQVGFAYNKWHLFFFTYKTWKTQELGISYLNLNKVGILTTRPERTIDAEPSQAEEVRSTPPLLCTLFLMLSIKYNSKIGSAYRSPSPNSNHHLINIMFNIYLFQINNTDHRYFSILTDKTDNLYLVIFGSYISLTDPQIFLLKRGQDHYL